MLRSSDGTRRSEWLQKGVFRIDTRNKVEDGTKIEKITFKGYDDMLKTEQDYEDTALNWPAKDMDVVRRFCRCVPVSRFLVNAPAAQGGIGATTKLFPALTLGCGAVGGSSSSNNISPLDLVNIRKVAWGQNKEETLVEILTAKILERLK